MKDPNLPFEQEWGKQLKKEGEKPLLAVLPQMTNVRECIVVKKICGKKRRAMHSCVSKTMPKTENVGM